VPAPDMAAHRRGMHTSSASVPLGMGRILGISPCISSPRVAGSDQPFTPPRDIPRGISREISWDPAPRVGAGIYFGCPHHVSHFRTFESQTGAAKCHGTGVQYGHFELFLFPFSLSETESLVFRDRASILLFNCSIVCSIWKSWKANRRFEIQTRGFSRVVMRVYEASS
jgi:hypothetical protein